MKNLLSTLICFLLFINATTSQVPKPEDVFGFQVGADYKLADYSQMLDYYNQLSQSSKRVIQKEIGKSVLGKPMLLLIISSEANIAKMEEYRMMSESLGRAKIQESLARQYAKEGKAVIWIDGGMHANERAHGQMTAELAWRVATEESNEMKKIRENVIFLLMPVMNPDGLDIITSWYKKYLGTPFETTDPAWLYHHYIGHDNNRDWFMNNMPETYHVNEVLYHQWFPQVVYNQHQTGPSWTRIFVPPFTDPVNPRIHPGITTATNAVGSSMSNYFAMHNMSGVVSQVQYSMWWNGGGRTAPYFHNMIGILTETSHRTPTPRMFPKDKKPAQVGERRGGLATDGTKVFYPYPWEGGESHFRDAVDYMIGGSIAVLKYAADRKEELLYNIYKMGRDAIEGKILNDGYAYVIPANQRDKREVVNLVNILRQGGVEIHEATNAFTAGDKRYHSGSYIAYTAQAFRPFLVDLLEKQEYPDKRSYPGGPPVPPYDLAGWTLPYQMGIQVDKIANEFKADVVEVKTRANIKSGTFSKANYGYIVRCKENAAYAVINKLLSNKTKIFRAVESTETINAGDFIIKGDEGINDLAKEYGVDFIGLDKEPTNKKEEIKQPKVGLYKSWVSNMDEGWTRWILTEYHFDWDTLHDQDIEERNLNQYDVIIIPDQSPDRILNGHRLGFMPMQYTGGLGLEGSLKLKKYVEAGGKLVTFDKASDYAIDLFGLPIKNTVKGLSDTDFFIPGSLIRTIIDVDHPLAYGMQKEVAASFNRSRAFDILVKENKGEGGNETTVAEQMKPDVDIIASYAKEDLLMSGWALNEKKHIGGKGAMAKIQYGEGEVILFGFRPQFRGQPRGTYKLVFNALY